MTEELAATDFPVGGIIAWPGDPTKLPSADWHLCDGAEYPANRALNDAIGVLYGNAVRLNHLKLPDFRGYFLRGVEERITEPLGVPQAESFKRHRHSTMIFTHNPVPTGNGPYPDGVTANPAGIVNQTQDEGGPETRPKNFAIHWIIRVK